jgi:catechol 2,3-dioxygenase-like lactoylglutathione lyase family enzyme
MSDIERPGSVVWIDHYVVASDDIMRWTDFMSNVVGAHASLTEGGGRFIQFQELTSCCHHGVMKSRSPLPRSDGLGKGLPRHALFIRPQDVDQHLRRLDEYNVAHLDAMRTSSDGEEGISIAWEDPDGNQFEFWAPDRMPEGAMADATSAGVGRISHAVYECRDLQRAADLFATYCGLEPRLSQDLSNDTLVLRTLGGARIIYKNVDDFSQRTAGWGGLSATHAALVVRDEDLWSNYDRMWADLPEWEYDRERGHFVGVGPDLPARTARHGSPAGQRFYDIRGRGDDWFDWDTNCFHFMGGAPQDRAFSAYEPHTMTWHLPRYVEAHRPAAAQSE